MISAFSLKYSTYKVWDRIATEFFNQSRLQREAIVYRMYIEYFAIELLFRPLNHRLRLIYRDFPRLLSPP